MLKRKIMVKFRKCGIYLNKIDNKELVKDEYKLLRKQTKNNK